MSAAISVRTDDFDKEVLQADKLVIVDFWAEWCGPCKMIAPLLDEIAREMGDKVKIVKVNIEEEPKLMERYEISAIPTLLFVKGGAVKDQVRGTAAKKVFVEKINALAS